MKPTTAIKKIATLSVILLLCAATAWLVLNRHNNEMEELPPPVYPLSRHVQYSFTLHNRTNHTQEHIRFNIRAPVKQTASQLATKLSCSHAYDLTTDSLGNRVIHLSFDRLPPYATRIVKVRASLAFSKTPNRLPETNMKIFLEPQPYCESQHRDIRQLAANLKKKDAAETAAEIYRWICTHVKYSGYLKHPRGACYALRKGKGDCTEFMYLFAALCRANGIPSRCIGGYVCKKDSVLHPGGYHNWAEFYMDGRWWVADPQNGIFKKHGDWYLVLKIIGSPSPDNLTTDKKDFELFYIDARKIDIKMD